MARFLPPDAFSATTEALSLLPFNLERSGTKQYLVANMVGDFIRLTEDELNRLVDLQIQPGDGLYEKAYAAHLITGTNQKAQRQLLALRLRSRMSFLRHVTPLHIFVVTLRCEHSCPYCQVSRQSTDRSRFDMSEKIAAHALDVAFDSPSARIKIEFQGGEPLLNFSLVRTIVSAAKARSTAVGKRVDFVIASNLALLDDAVLDFCKSNDVLLSTSLDGPADLHNKNRPRPGGNSHELAVNGIRRAREKLGRDRVGALMTTTEASLDRVDDIIDEYIELGLDGIFLRPLSPFGFAVKTKQFQKYDAQKWLDFYERGLRRILEINRQGTLVLSDKLIGAVSSSLTQCAPECSTCVYESHCGADPVYHHATQGDALGIKPLSAFCARQKGIMGLLLDILDSSPKDAAILRRWAAP